ncbi:MAG: DegT/DnrJ/EryC1/StrS family aminotransferase [Anaerolineae bacterium]|nr:DegT/DnrJ/EryC1/StrS family aminotransferase [Anaerolineae bacterium]
MMQQRIPVLDLSCEVDDLWDELNAAIQTVLRSGQFIMGPQVAAFEEHIARYLGVKHAIGLNSGTDALVLALRALGVGEGDEVITTPFTFFATAEAISMVGAAPVFVDIDPITFNINPALIEEKITARTRAILPVHLYGQAAEMEAILTLAQQHNLFVLEDVAQALGGTYKGRTLGTLGDIGAFSFFPSKPLGAYGDGGLLVTNDDAYAEMVRMLRTHGAKKKYYNEMLGYNSRLDTIQAAILDVKLPHIDMWNDQRRQVARFYDEALATIPHIVTPAMSQHVRHVYHQYTVRIGGQQRDRVQRELANAGISSMVYYPTPVHRLPYYAGTSPALPVAEQAAGEVLSLPIWPQMSRAVQETVVTALRNILA